MTWQTPIYDRTEADLEYLHDLRTEIEARGGWRAATAELQEAWLKNHKGAFNYADLNRIESNIRYLADILLGLGFSVNVTCKTNWTERDMPALAQINRIRSNVEALQRAFYTMPEWRQVLHENRLDFNQANDLEWDIDLCGRWLTAMTGAFLRVGTFYMGGPYLYFKNS